MRAAARGNLAALFGCLLGLFAAPLAYASAWTVRDDLAAVFLDDHSFAFACQRGMPVVIFTASGKQAGIFREGESYALEFVGADGGIMEAGSLAADHNTLGIRYRDTLPAMFRAPVTIRVLVRGSWREFKTPASGAQRAISLALRGCNRF